MPDDTNPNEKKGKAPGLVDAIKTGVREDLESLKTDLPAKAKESLETLKSPTKTQVYTSIFRHKHDDTPRNRALGVLSNVFLHLHPAKINRDSVRYSYTWGMGGITFYLFLVLTFTPETGVIVGKLGINPMGTALGRAAMVKQERLQR